MAAFWAPKWDGLIVSFFLVDEPHGLIFTEASVSVILSPFSPESKSLKTFLHRPLQRIQYYNKTKFIFFGYLTQPTKLCIPASGAYERNEKNHPVLDQFIPGNKHLHDQL